MLGGRSAMPRLRVVELLPGEVPAELRDIGSPVWDSRESAERFMLRHGLSGVLGSVPDTPEYRHDFVARLWALRNGFTRTISSGRVFPDWVRMREAGIPSAYPARVRARMLLRAAAID
jgi:hypothetical protein